MATQKNLLTFLLISAVIVYCQEEGLADVETPPDPGETYAGQQAMSEEDFAKRQAIDQERNQRDAMGLNYEHIRSYSFSLKHTDEFILAVDFDHTIKGAVNVYMEVDNSYIENGYNETQKTRMVIFEDMRTVIYNQNFHHALGFQIEAKKGREYLFRFIKEGTNKLIILYLENYVHEGKTNFVLVTDVATDHQRRTNEIKNKLTTFLGYTEQNALLNDRISQVVREHTQMYMYYQIIETLLVLAITIGQVYFINRLLTKNSIV